MIYTTNEYLAHHGIDKQKWGHRNGPPYPLKPEQMTQTQRRANSDESWYKDKVKQEEKSKEKRSLFDFLKKKKPNEPLNDVETSLSSSKRHQIYKKADVREAYKHKSELSNRDIEALLKRYDLHQQLTQKVSNLEYKDKMKPKETLDRIEQYANTVSKLGKDAINIYNMAAAVANAFGDENWKPIKFGDFGGKKDKNKNNQNNKGKGNN